MHSAQACRIGTIAQTHTRTKLIFVEKLIINSMFSISAHAKRLNNRGGAFQTPMTLRCTDYGLFEISISCIDLLANWFARIEALSLCLVALTIEIEYAINV